MASSSPVTSSTVTRGRPKYDNPIYGERNESGLYDSIADQIAGMGPEALANIDYPDDITRHIEDWSKNHKYLNKDGNELKVSIVGEVMGPALGTIIRAHGNYFARDGDNFKPIDDKTKVKDVIALGIPTCATTKMYNTCLNQIVCVTQITEANADEDRRKGNVRRQQHDTMMVQLPVKYAVLLPCVTLAPTHISPDPLCCWSSQNQTHRETQAGRRRRGRRCRYRQERRSSREASAYIGAHYEPALLPDFGGDYFNLVKAKLVQHDIRDVNNNLIPPWDLYDALKPGTLVLVLVTLHCFNMVDDGGKERKERKIYQMNAHSIRVLAESDEYVEPRTRPIAPTAANRVTASLPARATASFNNFTIPVAAKSVGSGVASPAGSQAGSSAGGSSVTIGSGHEDGSDDMVGVEEAGNKKKSKRGKTV
ncbi:hypothetical protein B0H11DRAFT_1755436 [Mycena galericulata]|nr:hypothetical protein B0H11DRAFT_1755436 [Mycena galericulata]